MRTCVVLWSAWLIIRFLYQDMGVVRIVYVATLSPSSSSCGCMHISNSHKHSLTLSFLQSPLWSVPTIAMATVTVCLERVIASQGSLGRIAQEVRHRHAHTPFERSKPTISSRNWL